MAQFTGMILTKKGRDLQAKAEAGVTLTFTKVKIGDGQLAQGQSLEDLNDLVSPQKILTIGSVQAEGNGLCRIRANITNQGITQGFYVREIGLFAQDPQLGEILYAIATASAADYLPPEGGATVVNNQFDIIVIVGNATQISATISPSGIISQDDVAASGPNKIPRLNSAGKGEFSITGDADTVDGKHAVDFVQQSEVATNGANKVLRLGADGKANVSITGDATSVGGKTVGAGPNQIPTRDQYGRVVADHITEYKVVRSGKDANGIFTVVELRRPADDKLYMRSTLSNPDARGNYQTDTRVFYKADGTTVDYTKVYTLTYDADGDLVSEVPAP
ncbi:hypothetical protein QO009_002051 [Brevibacillus aydinogluensis]|uniref:phage tail-collar fiber domain-containing protein n=1 Tax=Brevibacillus aydinogluensis TaxID=927786 RepID=UPI00289307A9|nr:phage tail protein [Brevibacillus aydinogluensis]MDT3416183.1 hypothetical protein [Brevibacillus aydinogluensis]